MCMSGKIAIGKSSRKTYRSSIQIRHCVTVWWLRMKGEPRPHCPEPNKHFNRVPNTTCCISTFDQKGMPGSPESAVRRAMYLPRSDKGHSDAGDRGNHRKVTVQLGSALRLRLESVSSCFVCFKETHHAKAVAGHL